MEMEKAVRNRYSKAAKQPEASLCCAVSYPPEYLKAIPREVVEKDYGCGDPTVYLKRGETVLDLGSGTGKICFIASQVVGPDGRVIGVDMNDEMLGIARSAAQSVAARVGYSNVKFFKGKIQDLRLNRDHLEGHLKEHPVQTESELRELDAWIEDRSSNQPMVATSSVDAVISNCVLNLVEDGQKRELFGEIFRVLKRGGRAIISDIVSDEEVPAHLRKDPELWSGCISGVFQESAFMKEFEKAGFYGIEILKRDEKPWKVVEGIEFRSVTVRAFKGKEGDCWDHKEALIYKGPFKKVIDDDGHQFTRGQRTAVCRKTFTIFSKTPYRDYFEPVIPREIVPEDEARAFPCVDREMIRHPKETKGEGYSETSPDLGGASPGGGCC